MMAPSVLTTVKCRTEGRHTRGLFLLLVLRFGIAQAPVGAISGVVRDPSGAGLAAAQVKVRSLVTGLERSEAAAAQGDYGFPSLLAGEYEVTVEAVGFKRAVRQAL